MSSLFAHRDRALSAHRRLFASFNEAGLHIGAAAVADGSQHSFMKSLPTEPSPLATPFDDGALYDIFFERLDLGLDFYLGLAQAAGGPVLDVACGTGRIMLPCLKAGVDVEGLDLFPGMLSRLRQKASALGFDPKLHQANMAAFRLSRRYAFIMIPFNAFVHNLTADDQLATLQSCRDHLAPGGLLAFDTAFPGPSWITQPNGTSELE